VCIQLKVGKFVLRHPPAWGQLPLAYITRVGPHQFMLLSLFNTSYTHVNSVQFTSHTVGKATTSITIWKVQWGLCWEALGTPPQGGWPHTKSACYWSKAVCWLGSSHLPAACPGAHGSSTPRTSIGLKGWLYTSTQSHHHWAGTPAPPMATTLACPQTVSWATKASPPALLVGLAHWG